MNRVFEDFLTVALAEALYRYGGRPVRQHPSHLDQARRLAIRLDLTWWSAGVCRAVIDAKYKAVDPAQLPNADGLPGLRLLHRLLDAYRAPRLPGRRSGAGHDAIRNTGIEVQAHTLPLDGQPEEILASVERIARLVVHARPVPYPSASPATTRRDAAG